ncbi:MAG: general stress protein [Pseudobdellovibrionaceae bacterium]|nr:general stress protein [Pseudobdellovibrionaceae bacterium]
MAKNTATFAIFNSRASVERAVNALKRAGFRHSDISVLFPDRESTREFAHEKATKAPEGATTGTATGAILGGTLGWLVGMGSLAIPGIGPVIAAGPIMAALAGAGVGGAVGGITGALIGIGIPEYEAKRYEGLVKDGGILISVHCDDDKWVQLAKDIFKVENGDGIASAHEASSDEPRTGSYDRDRTMTPPTSPMTPPSML